MQTPRTAWKPSASPTFLCGSITQSPSSVDRPRMPDPGVNSYDACAGAHVKRRSRSQILRALFFSANLEAKAQQSRTAEGYFDGGSGGSRTGFRITSRGGH